MHLTPVAANDLAQAWPVAEPWLARACARPGCDIDADDLRRLCAMGAAALILIGETGRGPVAAGVAQVRQHPDGRRAAWVLAVGGAEARAWRHTLRVIEDGARRLGCATAEFIGRPGWARLLPDYAASAIASGTHYVKDLR